jgi:hypothetical protein
MRDPAFQQRFEQECREYWERIRVKLEELQREKAAKKNNGADEDEGEEADNEDDD